MTSFSMSNYLYSIKAQHFRLTSCFYEVDEMLFFNKPEMFGELLDELQTSLKREELPAKLVFLKIKLTYCS